MRSEGIDIFEVMQKLGDEFDATTMAAGEYLCPLPSRGAGGTNADSSPPLHRPVNPRGLPSDHPPTYLDLNRRASNRTAGPLGHGDHHTEGVLLWPHGGGDPGEDDPRGRAGLRGRDRLGVDARGSDPTHRADPIGTLGLEGGFT